MVFETTIPLSSDDNAPLVPVIVQFAHYPPRRGQRDRYGAPLEPDEPEDWEIINVTTLDGRPVPFEHFEDELLKQARKHYYER